MTTTERERHHMVRALEDSIGKEAAMTLAGHLPPVGWADVATKADLEHHRAVTDLRFDAIDQRFDAVDRRFDEMEANIKGDTAVAIADLRAELADRLAAQTRVLYMSVVTTVLTLIGLGLVGR